jgi:NAD+--asparagine ADP-ribosyltransferase
MDKHGRLLVASPLEFAAIFGKATRTAATESLAGGSGLPRGAMAVAPAESAKPIPSSNSASPLGSI